MTNTMSCGCKIISDNLGVYKIEYCPKHKAAPDMYEALRKGLVWIEDALRDFNLESDGTYEEMFKALAKAGI